MTAQIRSQKLSPAVTSEGGRYLSMRPLYRDLVLFALAAAAGMLATTAVLHMLRSPTRGLPWSDRFAEGDDSSWIAYDGNWNIQSGVMVNESNERGAKLVTGSQYWEDYALDGDIALSDSGDAGLIARVSESEPGVDSYRGVYVGLRVRDEVLVVGVADHGWNEEQGQPLPRPIVSGAWYHLRLELRGQRVTALTWPEGEPGSVVRVDKTLSQMPLSGKIGLRSYDSGGKWKNIRVTELQDGN
jgi:hypothetical protein